MNDEETNFGLGFERIYKNVTIYDPCYDWLNIKLILCRAVDNG